MANWKNYRKFTSFTKPHALDRAIHGHYWTQNQAVAKDGSRDLLGLCLES